MKRILHVMAVVAFMSFMASQSMAWTCGGSGGYMGNQNGGGYSNTVPTGYTNTIPTGNTSTDPNINSNPPLDTNYQNFLNDTASLREQLATKQEAYVALISQPNPDPTYASQLCRQMASLNNQIRNKAASYGCLAQGYYGYGNTSTDPNVNSNTVLDTNYQNFLNDTTSLRVQLAAKQGAYVALMSQPNPDPKYAGQLCLQMARLNNQIWDKAVSYGCPARGYYGYGGGWGGGGWGCW